MDVHHNLKVHKASVSENVLTLGVYGLYVLFGLLTSGGSTNWIVRGGLITVIVGALAIRLYTLFLTFTHYKLTYQDIANCFFSHVILFSAICMLLETEYTITDPSNIFLDSLFYSVDTVTTNGVANVIPKTGVAKLIHVINLIDSYVLLITLGFYIVRNLKLT
jgi:hypothetical protein